MVEDVALALNDASKHLSEVSGESFVGVGLMTCQLLEIIGGVVSQTIAERSCQFDYPVSNPLWNSHTQHRLFGGFRWYVNVLDLFP